MKFLKNLITLISPRKYHFYSQTSGNLDVISYFGKTTLYMNQIPQSGPLYHHMWRDIIQKLRYKKPLNGLMIGLGGGTGIKHLQQVFPKLDLIVVEIDPMIIWLAKKYFRIVESKKLIICQTDIRIWLSKNLNTKFNLIILDIFQNKFNPEFSRNGKFIQKIKNNLSQNGILVINSHYGKSKSDDAKYLKILSSQFSQVKDILQYTGHHVYICQN